MTLLQNVTTRDQFEAYCRSGVRICPVREQVVLAHVLGSQKILLDMRELNIGAHLAMDGFWESWITLAVAHHLQRGWRCIDVGANCGYYTLLLASLVGPEGHVFACEPNPDLVPWLRQSVSLNGFDSFVQVIEAAILDRSREVELFVPGATLPGSLNGTIVARSQDGISVTVAGRTLDDLCADQRVDFIKIDAEGAEILIWHGMKELLATNPGVTILLEFNAARYENPEGFVDLIRSEQFVLRHVGFDGSLLSVNPEELCDRRRTDDWMLWLMRA